MNSRVIELASLAVYTFGALTFLVLTALYWRERRSRRAQGLAFPSFIVASLVAFALNLLSQTSPDSAWANRLVPVLEVVTRLMPPLLVHAIYLQECGSLRRRRLWSGILVLFYGVSLATAAARSLDTAPEWVSYAPAFLLAAAGLLGLCILRLSLRDRSPREHRSRFWISALLGLLTLSAAANLIEPGPIVSVLPDYLMLGWFCVTLYYNERILFFDLVIKRGAFFVGALLALTTFLSLSAPAIDRFSNVWGRPWIYGLALTPLVLAAPWVYARLSDWIDHAWLRRRHTAVQAQHRFLNDIQSATTEDELRKLATESLSDIFQTLAEVEFEGIDRVVPLNGLTAGKSIVLPARSDSIPYLSDDVKLLESLAGMLEMAHENVRFREQQARQVDQERQLRLLASRAELKALRAQMNPHFLFNALNAIAGLIQDQPHLADETVENLAHVFRYVLRKSGEEWVRLEEEVEFVTAYLKVEQARFGDRLEVEFDVDPRAAALMIPAMTIQPLVENAIKHGTSAIEGPGRVSLSIHLVDDLLVVEVSDNGPGFAVGPTEGRGLQNVKDRLRGYYGGDASVNWTHREGVTVVTFQVTGVKLRTGKVAS